jgi:hypothetical protein
VGVLAVRGDYLPIFVYWLWLSVKARSLFFFSAANPSIENGGMLGGVEAQDSGRSPLPSNPSPCWFVRPPNSFPCGKPAPARNRLPLIAKPDVGERGWKVEKLHNPAELAAYHAARRRPT